MIVAGVPSSMVTVSSYLNQRLLCFDPDDAVIPGIFATITLVQRYQERGDAVHRRRPISQTLRERGALPAHHSTAL